VPLARDDLHLGERPHEALHRIEDFRYVARGGRNDRHTQLRRLPTVLFAYLCGGDPEPVPATFDYRPQDSSLFL
jgi:hypothetical protein